MTGAALLKGIESAAGLSCCKHRSLQNQPGLQEGPAHRSGWGPQPGHAAGTEGCTGISWYVRCRIRRGEPNKSSQAPPLHLRSQGTEPVSFATEDAHLEHRRSLGWWGWTLLVDYVFGLRFGFFCFL